MIDLSVHIDRMKAHIEADELVRGLGFAAAFAQATKKGRPRQECSPRRSTLYCLPKLVAGALPPAAVRQNAMEVYALWLGFASSGQQLTML